MPEISPERAASDLGSETSTIYLDTLRFEHSQIDTLRLVDNTEDIERADGLYVAFPMRSVYPAQTGQRPPELKIDVDIVDQRVMIALRSLRAERARSPRLSVALRCGVRFQPPFRCLSMPNTSGAALRRTGQLAIRRSSTPSPCRPKQAQPPRLLDGLLPTNSKPSSKKPFSKTYKSKSAEPEP